MRGSNHQTFEKLDEDIGVDAAFFLDHEAHVTVRRDRRDQASVTGLGLSIPFLITRLRQLEFPLRTNTEHYDL